MPKQPVSVLINMVPFAFGRDGAADRKDYLEALHSELASAADYAEDYEVTAVGITGANPLQYPADALSGVIKTLRSHLPFSIEPEITLHAMPGSATHGDMRELNTAGVNRISFDMHSFVPAELEALGRTYAPSAMEVFMRMVQLKLVFFNYDVTLYYGLPGQTPESLSFSIEQAIKYMAMHITLLPYPGMEGIERDRYYKHAVDTLRLTSFSEYTPQHFARYGYDSRWIRLSYSNQPRLGFGVDAVSRIDGMITRNTQDVAAYVQAKGDPAGTIVSVDPISMEDVERANLQDALFNLKEIDLKLINSSLRERVIELLARGLLQETEQRVSLSTAGRSNWESTIETIQR